MKTLRMVTTISTIVLLLSMVSIASGQNNSEPVISLDFESEPDVELFDMYGGVIENGKLTFSLPNEEDYGEFYINPSFTNYAVEMDYNVTSGSGIIYILMHLNILENGAFCNFEFTYDPLEGYANSATYGDGCLDWIYMDDNSFEPILADQTVRLRAEVLNNTYRLLIDGVEVLVSEDTTYTEGRTGFWFLGETEISFDNIALYDLDASSTTTPSDNLVGGEINQELAMSFDFESEPQIELFEIYDGAIEDGKLTFSQSSEEDYGQFYINTSLSNYAVEMDYNVTSETIIIYIMMHTTVFEDGMFCSVEFEYYPLDGYVSAYTYGDECQEWIYLDENVFDPIAVGQTARLRAEVFNNTYKLLIDGVEVIASEDMTFTDGGTGVGIWGETQVSFDNIVLYDLDATSSVVPDNIETEEAPSGALFGNTDSSNDTATEAPSGALFGNTDSSNDTATEAPSGALFGNTDSSNNATNSP